MLDRPQSKFLSSPSTRAPTSRGASRVLGPPPPPRPPPEHGPVAPPPRGDPWRGRQSHRRVRSVPAGIAPPHWNRHSHGPRGARARRRARRRPSVGARAVGAHAVYSTDPNRISYPVVAALALGRQLYRLANVAEEESAGYPSIVNAVLTMGRYLLPKKMSANGRCLRVNRIARISVAVASVLAAWPSAARAQSTAVAPALGGVGYLAPNVDIGRAFPSVVAAERQRLSAGSSFDADLREAFRRTSGAMRVDLGLAPDLGIGVVFAFTQESVTSERYIIGEDTVTKFVVQLGGELILADFGASKSLIGAVPAVSEIVRVTRGHASDESFASDALRLVSSQDSTSLFTQAVAASAQLAATATGQCRVQVGRVDVDSLMSVRPNDDRTESDFAQNARRWIASELGRAWLTGTGLPLLPWAGSQAIDGRLALRFADSRALSLSIPPADFLLHIAVRRVRRVPYARSAAGESFVHGLVVQVAMTEPVSTAEVFTLEAKNAVVTVVPALQSARDDWSPVREALRGLLHDLPRALATNDNAWLSTHVVSADGQTQARALSTMRKRCGIS